LEHHELVARVEVVRFALGQPRPVHSLRHRNPGQLWGRDARELRVRLQLVDGPLVLVDRGGERPDLVHQRADLGVVLVNGVPALGAAAGLLRSARFAEHGAGRVYLDGTVTWQPDGASTGTFEAGMARERQAAKPAR